MEWKAHVELLTPRGSEKIPLALSPGGDLLLGNRVFVPGRGLREGDEIQARMVFELAGHRMFLPRHGYRTIRVSEFDAIDPGEGDEVELTDRGASQLQRFPSGLEAEPEARCPAQGCRVQFAVEG